MDWLLRLYSRPHEALHVLALRLIGRRPVAVGRQHVDIPDDLTTRQYVFVAGLPALVFGALTLAGVLALLNAGSLVALALAWLVIMAGGFGAAGTVGDIQLIVLRLMDEPHA
jgi:hypothetical protein